MLWLMFSVQFDRYIAIETFQDCAINNYRRT